MTQMTWIRQKPGTEGTRCQSFVTLMPKATTIRSAAAGMTLLELMIACSILIVLATAAIPMVRVSIARHREAALRYDLRQMRDAIDRYKDAADKNLIQVKTGTEGYPPDLETLVKGVQLTSATGQSVHFLRQIPPDPMTGTADWGMRSVQDDPDSNSWGGQDLFDVYCPSTATGLDGTQYSTW